MPHSYWQSTASVLTPNRPPTPLERQAIREVHELADRFADGRASLDEIRAATSGKQRNLASRFTPPNDPAFRPLMTMLDALIADEPNVFVTNAGVYGVDDIVDGEGKIDPAHNIIRFPIRRPWRVRPEPDRGVEGIRGEPIYLRAEDRGPKVGSFSQTAPVEFRSREAEWWEMPSTEEAPF